MVEVRLRHRTVDLPYTVRIHDVTEEMFDEMVDEDTKAELIDGVMIVHSPASPRHDDLGGFLRTLMRVYAEEREHGLVLGPDSLIHLEVCRKVAPDIFFFLQHRLPVPLPEKEFDLTPDLIVEIVSFSNWAADLEIKRPAYQQAGVGEIWFVDLTENQIIIDRRRRKGYATTTVGRGRVASTVLPGFWIDAGWLWMERLPKATTCLRRILKG